MQLAYFNRSWRNLIIVVQLVFWSCIITSNRIWQYFDADFWRWTMLWKIAEAIIQYNFYTNKKVNVRKECKCFNVFLIWGIYLRKLCLYGDKYALHMWVLLIKLISIYYSYKTEIFSLKLWRSFLLYVLYINCPFSRSSRCGVKFWCEVLPLLNKLFELVFSFSWYDLKIVFGLIISTIFP